jgi:hypothetical protein
VQHGQKADLRTQMLGVGGNPGQRLGDRPKQNIVDHDLVLERDDGDLVRHGEDDVEIWRIEQFGLPVLKPLSPGKTLALGTIPVSATNGEFPLLTLWANSVMGSHGRLLSEGRRFRAP